MILKLVRNGRMWEGNNGPEEVLDVFYGEGYGEKLERGLCNSSYKKIIKQELAVGEHLFVSLEIVEAVPVPLRMNPFQGSFASEED